LLARFHPDRVPHALHVLERLHQPSVLRAHATLARQRNTLPDRDGAETDEL
jgi:hypothetical protein